MSTTANEAVTRSLRSILLQLARVQDDIACDLAAATPYWESCPSSVLGHREAAAALRAEADHFLASA